MRLGRLFYNVGVVFGVVGQLAGWFLLVQSILSPPPQNLRPNHPNQHLQPSPPPSLPKREIGLVVPGVTLPWSDTPFLIVGVVLSQVIHELGHALAALNDGLRVKAIGFTMKLWIFPTMYVSLPPSSGTLRVIAAGPFHNILLYTLLHMSLPSFLRLSTSSSFLGLLYTRQENVVVVTSVEHGSPLYPFLPTGTVVTHLDDVPANLWDDYLLDNGTNTVTSPALTIENGWCVEVALFNAATSECCYDSPPPLPMAHLACFNSSSTSASPSLPSVMKCLDPVPILTNPSHPRCTSDSSCNASTTCIRPLPKEQLLRIRTSSILLWSGPKHHIHDQVKVTPYIPRFLPVSFSLAYLPFWLPETLHALIEYTKLATLSLYIFNLLPFPSLDGHQFLKALLNAIFPSQSLPMHAHPLTHGHDYPDRICLFNRLSLTHTRKRQILTYTTYTTSALLAVSVCLSILRLWESPPHV